MKREDTRILVVDDESIICQMFQHTLKKKCFSVDVALDGEEALMKCLGEPYHIVVTDLKMPRKDGMSLLRDIKSRWPATEVIVITGYATIESAIEAMKIGASDFILKPVNFENVNLIVQKCYERLAAQWENAELRAENYRLQELNLLKDKFLSITNHEMRTPIMVVKGYLDILALSSDEENPETREIMDILTRTVAEMRESVDRMHMLSRLRKKDWYDNAQQFDCMPQVVQIGSDMVLLFERRNLTLKVKMSGKELPIYGSLPGIRIVIRELLQNALKFTPDGGVITLSGERCGNEVKLSIADNGIGIAEDKQELIFTDFYEVQNTFHHKSSKEDFLGGGLGIGLALVREVVSSLEGRIVVQSEVGSGACFSVFFPLCLSDNKPTKFDSPAAIS